MFARWRKTPPPTPDCPRWEYTQSSFNAAWGDEWMKILNEHGEEGWEAWHMEIDRHGWRIVYLKRSVRHA